MGDPTDRLYAQYERAHDEQRPHQRVGETRAPVRGRARFPAAGRSRRPIAHPFDALRGEEQKDDAQPPAM